MDKATLKLLKKGKSREHQKVLDYFLLEGCFAKSISDSDYLSLVHSKRDSLKLRQTALNKIGIDEDELQEVPPATMEGFVYDKAWAKKQASGNWVSSTYEVAWIFCSSTQVYMYRCRFLLDEDKKSEYTDEFFYKDVTSISTSSDHEEIKNKDKSGKSIEVESHKFVMVVPGDKLFVSLDQVDNAEAIIQGLKQKLREKKMS